MEKKKNLTQDLQTLINNSDNEDTNPNDMIKDLLKILQSYEKAHAERPLETVKDSLTISVSGSTAKADLKKTLSELCSSESKTDIILGCKSVVSAYIPARTNLDYLTRFIVACEGSSSSKILNIPINVLNENVKRIVELIKIGRGNDVLNLVYNYKETILVRYEPLVIVLGVCAICGAGDVYKDIVKRAYEEIFPAIVTTPPRLFCFIHFCQLALTARNPGGKNDKKKKETTHKQQSQADKTESASGAKQSVETESNTETKTQLRERKKKETTIEQQPRTAKTKSASGATQSVETEPNIETKTQRRRRQRKKKKQKSMDSPDQNREPPTKITKEEVDLNNMKIIIANKPEMCRNHAWGALRRKAIANFYVGPHMTPEKLLFMTTKCRRRHGWTHQQVLRKCHAKTCRMTNENAEAINLVLCYLVRGLELTKKTKEKYDQMGSKEQPTDNIMNKIELVDKVYSMNCNRDGTAQLLAILDEHVQRKTEDDKLQYVYESRYPKESTDDVSLLLQPFHIVKEHIPHLFISSRDSKEVC